MSVRTNLVTNPTFEINEGGWDNPGTRCTLSASTDRAWSGSKSLKVVHNQTVGANQSGTGWPNYVLTNGTVYTFSVYVYIPTGSPHINLNVQGGGYSATGTTTTAYDTWQRLTVTLTGNGNGAYFYLLNTTTTAPGQTFYVDAALLEASASAGTYFDGSTVQSNYINAWTGTSHASASTSTALPQVVQVVAGTLVASNAATVTSTLTNAIVAGDVVVALIACNAASTNHSMAGLGATWTRVGKDTSGLLDLWVGTGATATGTVTATQTTSVAGGFKQLNLWHVRGTTTAYVGGVDDASGDYLTGTGMPVGPGQIFIGSGYATNSVDTFLSPLPATDWVNSGDLNLATSRYASRVHRIPANTDSHQFGTYRPGSPSHPIVRLAIGTNTSVAESAAEEYVLLHAGVEPNMATVSDAAETVLLNAGVSPTYSPNAAESVVLNTSPADGSTYLLDFSDTCVGPTMDYSQANGKMRIDTDIPSGVGATKSLSWLPLQNVNDVVAVQMAVTLEVAGQVSFYRKTSSENSFDYLHFYIDGVQQAQWAGETAWGQVTYALPVGTHVLKWSFTHDGSGWAYSNTAWIALVQVTHLINPPPTHYSALPPATFNFEDGLVPSRLVTSSWINSTDNPITGTRSMRSPNPPPSSTAGIYDLTIDTSYLTENALVSFDYKRDSESPDRLWFLVDGVVIWPTPYTGITSTDTGTARFIVAPGTNSITVRYSKDGSVSAGLDACWIDNLVMPFYVEAPFPQVVNLINNADAEVDTTGWSTTVGTLTRQTNRWVNGTANFQLSPINPATVHESTAYTTVTGLYPGKTYTLSGFVSRPSGTSAIQLFVNAGGTFTYSTESILGGNWEALKLTFVATTTSVNVGITNAQAISTTTLLCCDTMTLVEGTSDEPFSPFTPARSGVTFKPMGSVGASPTIKSTGRVNLAKNPAFGTGDKWGWKGTVDAGSTVYDADNGLYGAGCLKSNATGTFHRVRGSNGAANIAEMIPVTPGRRYTASIWVRSVGGQTQWNIYMTGANSSGTTTAAYSGGPSFTASVGTWVRGRVSFTAVAGDAYVWPTLDSLATNGYSYYWDGFMVEETGGNTDMDKVAPYFDGDQHGEEWVTNSWMSTPHASPSVQIPNPDWVRPEVVGIHDSAISTTTTTTIDLPVTPSNGDVLVLLTMWSTSNAYPPPTAVSGCGATWTRIDGGTDQATAWVGTGANASGTITATHTAVTARAARLYHTRGTTSDALLLLPDSAYPPMANPNQIAIGLAHQTTGTESSLVGGGRTPYYGWVNSTDLYMTATRKSMSAYLRPVGITDVYHIGNTYGGVLILGSPVRGYVVKRRNPVRNSSFQSTVGWGTTIIPTSSVSTHAFAGSRSVGGSASSTGAALVTQSTASGNFGAVKGGVEYTASIYVWCSAARTASVRLAWRNAGDANLTTTAWSTPVALTAAGWTRVSGTFTAHADACYAEFNAQINVVNADTAYIDAAQIDEGPVALPYMDGAVAPDPGEVNLYTGQWDFASRWPYQYESLTLMVPPVITALVKVREGGVWVVKTPAGKARLEGAWVESALRYWDGAEWIAI